MHIVSIAFILLSLTPLAGLATLPEHISGTLIVVNKGEDSASFIDLTSGNTVATLPTGKGPHEVVISQDGRWAVVTNYAGGNSLTVFDVVKLTTVKTINLSAYPRPHGIAFMPGDKQVVVTSEASNTLVVVDIHRAEIVGDISTSQAGSHMLALSPDGNLAVTSNGQSNSVSVIDLQKMQLVKILKVPNAPEAITLSEKGEEIWVGSNNQGMVSVFSKDSGKRLAQWQGFKFPYRILLSKNQNYAVIPDLANNNLRFFDAQTKTELGSLQFDNAGPEGVIFHPDDRTLFLSLTSQNKAVAIDIISQRILAEFTTGDRPDGIAYSHLVLNP